MDGILSGLFTQSKKDKGRPADTDSSSKDQASKSPINNDKQPTKGDFLQDSSAPPLNNRSPDMRLSKGTTPSKKEEDFDVASEPVMPSFSSSSSSSPKQSSSSTESTPSAVIGAKIKFKGELTGEEDLLIQGRLEGVIDLKGNHLTIGEQGMVKANLMARTITIHGTVEGDIIGQERIEIKSKSNVRGNLVAARVTLEDGAKFRGSIDMESAGKSLGTSKPTSSSMSSSSSASSASSSSANASAAAPNRDKSKESPAKT